MAQPTNTLDSYDVKGIREDLSDVIYNISPEDKGNNHKGLSSDLCQNDFFCHPAGIGKSEQQMSAIKQGLTTFTPLTTTGGQF